MENKSEVVTTGVISTQNYGQHSRPDDPEIAAKVDKASKSVAVLEKKVKDITNVIEKEVAAIRKMDTELAKTIPDLVEQLEALQAEEQHLIAQGKKTFDEDAFDFGDEDDPFKDHNSEFSTENPLLEDDAPDSDTDYRSREKRRADKKAEKNRYANCKDLFRKIARLTHPDKTTSVRKHEIFLRAKLAIEALDLESLQLMYVEVTTSESDLLRRMRNRLKQVKVEYEEVKAQHFQLKQSDQYLMLNDWNVDAYKPKVIDHFKNIVMLNIEAIRERVRKLDPERYKPVNNFFMQRDLDEDDIIDMDTNRRPRL